MKNIKYIFTLLLFLSSFLLWQSCGQGGLDNPLGVLGGGFNGYGSSGFRDYSGRTGDGGGTQPNIVGNWRHEVVQGSYEIYRFTATGQYEHSVEAYGQTQIIDEGTYSINGNTIIFHMDTGGSYSKDFSLSGNTLILDGVTFHRF